MYSNDTAADLKEDYRDLIAEGLAPEEATAQLVAEYGVGSNPDIDHDFWLALAVTGHKLGYLTPESLAKAMEVIDDPTELERWPESLRRQRRAALAKARHTLNEPQPDAKRLRARVKANTNLEPGQHVRWHIGHGKPDAVFRVLDVHLDKGGRHPILLALRWGGSATELHNAHRLDALPGGFDPLRQRELALGFFASGHPTDPTDLELLDSRNDARTPNVGLNYRSYVVRWTEMHRFFTATGHAAIPPESPPSKT
jgi:hypothetical protein